MAGPPPAIGPVVFQAIRATAYDLPEDFVSRLEPGLDASTKRSLESGVRVLRRLRAVWRWTWAGFVVGVFSLVFGGFIWSRFPLFGGILAGLGPPHGPSQWSRSSTLSPFP